MYPCKNERVGTREKCVLMRNNTVIVSALDAANAFVQRALMTRARARTVATIVRLEN